ncbi:MAG: cytochrome c biogenesis protein ResB [Phycisphaerales bacterium]|nr:cytochrome c biogenesis protein ResB [Phycisphaerales bacterium]
MAHTHAWHKTPIGRVVCFVGDLRTVIPGMILVAIALIAGTWIESASTAEIARARVYGSWWFILLMVWMCASLLFAVIERYPWRRRHVGFILVHAGLVVLIVGGFTSLFTRVEGHITLREGMSSNMLEIAGDQLQWHVHEDGGFTTEASTVIDSRNAHMAIGDVRLTVVGRWANSEAQSQITDDGAEPFHAVEIAFDHTATTGSWLGQTASDEAAPVMNDIRLRVLPIGEEFQPQPTTEGDATGPHFVIGGEEFPLGEADQQAFPGWRVVSVARFRNAMVGDDGLQEGDPGGQNPAIQVVLTDDAGTIERHFAFAGFPQPMSRIVQGTTPSGAALHFGHGPSITQRVVFQRTEGGLRTVREGADGVIADVSHKGSPPYDVELDDMRFRVLSHFTHAQRTTEFVEAPAGEANRPVLLVKLDDGPQTEPVHVPWNGEVPFTVEGQPGLLRYGPATRELPFTVQLDDFRRTDYPGSRMAMAYESDVAVKIGDGKWQPHRIWMNNPFKHAGWKVYQSSYIGDDVSVFSVMKDPGLPLTYIGCTLLCVGIVIVFYSRVFSHGHPGVPMLGSRKGGAQ